MNNDMREKYCHPKGNNRPLSNIKKQPCWNIYQTVTDYLPQVNGSPALLQQILRISSDESV